MKNKKINVQYMTELALLTAITLVMAYTPLGYLRVGLLNASFLTIPIAVGAILLGPGAGAFLGLIFGLTSFGNALSGGSAFGMALTQVSVVRYFIQAVAGRVLAGFFCGLIYRMMRRLTHGKWVSYAIGAISAPLLNTVFYMGLLILLFYRCDYIQNLVVSNGITNPIALVIMLVGVQGVLEAVICGTVGCIVSRTVDRAVGGRRRESV
jgi:uncharacterized membrane protein